MRRLRRLVILAVLLVPSLSWAQFANEPSGFSPLLNHSFTTILGANMTDPYGAGALTTDASAPLSPSSVYFSRLPAGSLSGGSELHWNSPTVYRELFIGKLWRTNPGFQGRTVGNKMFLVRGPGSNGVFLFGNGALSGGTAPMIFAHNTSGINNNHACPQFALGEACFPNVGSGTLTVGVWTNLQAYIKCSTTATSRDGIVRWWVNGVPAGNYTNLNYCPGGLNEWVWSETWDGTPGFTFATVDWIHYLDHLYISGPDCSITPSGCGIGPSPPPPPPSPTPPSPTPPPPPSSCGTSSSTSNDSVLDFCSTQGPRWYYLNGDLSAMSFSGSLWAGAQLYQGIWDAGQHPGSSSASIRQWVAPTTGDWTISGVTGDYDGGGGNGVTVTIKQNNSTTLYTRSIANGAGDASYSLSVSLTAGETIEFIVEQSADNSYDSTHFTAQLALVVPPPPPPPGPPPPPPPPPPSLVGNCIVQWTANGEADVSFYRAYWGVSPGVYGVPLAVPLSSVPTTTCKALGITAAGTYYLAIAAVDHSGNEGTKSSEVTLVFAGTTPDVTAPVAPQNVSAQ